MILHVLASILGLLGYALLAAFEAAYHTEALLFTELNNQQGRLLKMNDSPGRLNMAILTFIALSLAVYSVSVWHLMAMVVGQSALGTRQDMALIVLQALLAVSMLLIFGELLPKIIARRRPTLVLKLSAPVVYIMYLIAGPIHQLVQKWKQRAERDLPEPMYSKHDLKQMIDLHLGQKSLTQMLDPRIFANALRFNRIRVGEFMVPRSEIVAADKHTPPEMLRQMFVDTELSRILIYDKDPDRVIGYIHSQRMFEEHETIERLVKPVSWVHSNMTAHRLMAELNATGRSIAAVMDDNKLSGLVTVEDMVEVVFGEIADEHDEQDVLIEEVLNENAFRLSVRLELSYLADKYEIHIPDGQYATLGGAILATERDTFSVGDTVYLADYLVTIEEILDERPEVVHLERISSSDAVL